MKVIDGTDQILGRVSSGVAKLLLAGEEVVVINAERLVMTGDLDYLIEKYKKRRGMKDKSTPEHSPHWPRRPDLFVKRIVRGMLPWDKARGRAALKRLRVYMGSPEVDGERISIPGAHAEKLNTKYHTVATLCERLGYAR